MLKLTKDMIVSLSNGIKIVNITSHSITFRIPDQPENSLITVHGYDIGLEIETEYLPVRIYQDVVIQNLQFICDPDINKTLSEFAQENDCFILGTENQAMSYPGVIYMATPYRNAAIEDPWFNIHNPYKFITFYTGSGKIKLSKLKEVENGGKH